jgi:hypothetical protein
LFIDFPKSKTYYLFAGMLTLFGAGPAVVAAAAWLIPILSVIFIPSIG